MLARIKEQRVGHYEQQLSEWKAAVKKWEKSGKKGPKPQKPAVFKPPTPLRADELSRLPTMPESWQALRLCEVAAIGSGMSVSKARKLADPVEVPYLRVANVQRGYLTLDEVKTMRVERSQLDGLALKKWDVLFNEGGDRDKLGRGWIWESQIEPCITQNHVFRASPFLRDGVSAKWISYWNSAFGQRYFDTEGKQTTNLASINKTVLSNFPLPVAPIVEQEEIINRIESQLAIVDNIEAEVDDQLAKANALRQSILTRAFSGQLVAQDPADEPASVLLERIKAEQGSAAKNSKTTKKKTTTKKRTAA